MKEKNETIETNQDIPASKLPTACCGESSIPMEIINRNRLLTPTRSSGIALTADATLPYYSIVSY